MLDYQGFQCCTPIRLGELFPPEGLLLPSDQPGSGAVEETDQAPSLVVVGTPPREPNVKISSSRLWIHCFTRKKIA